MLGAGGARDYRAPGRLDERCLRVQGSWYGAGGEVRARPPAPPEIRLPEAMKAAQRPRCADDTGGLAPEPVAAAFASLPRLAPPGDRALAASSSLGAPATIVAASSLEMRMCNLLG
jgi:hypothetical protein